MRAFATALSLLCLLAATVAGAQCAIGPDTSTLSIEGLGAAYYQQVRTDTAADLVEFYGGVCLAGEGGLWTVTAERVVITGLRGGLKLSAQPATVTVAGWQLEAASLEATPERLDMKLPNIKGPELSGSAYSASMNLVTGAVELRTLTVRYASVVARGSEATLAGNELVLDHPMVTSCTCPGTPFYSVRGQKATVDLGMENLMLEGGSLHIAGIVLPLEDPIQLSAETLAGLTLPLQVAYVPDAPGKRGTGLGVTVEPLPLWPGLDGEFGATGLDWQYPLRPVAVLHASTPTATVSVGKRAGGLGFEVVTDHTLTPWLDAGFDVRLFAPTIRDGLKEGVLHVSAHAPVPAIRGQVSARAFAAASAQDAEASTGTGAGAGAMKAEVSGARLGVAFDASTATVTGPVGKLSVQAHAELTGYPDLPPRNGGGTGAPGMDATLGASAGALQWGVRIAPTWRYTGGPVTLQVSYHALWTNAASPFTTELDRLTPLQRVNTLTRVAGTIAPSWSGSFEVRGGYDLIPVRDLDTGLNSLAVGASLKHTLSGWDLEADVNGQLAGVVAPDGKRDGRLVASVTAGHLGPWGEGRLELGTRARYLFAPHPVGLDLLELNAAVPIELPGVELRPYLAVDLAPTLLRSELPAISGHGLTATFETCCGAFSIGYRNQENVWSATFAIDLERRLPEAVDELHGDSDVVGAPGDRDGTGGSGGVAHASDGPGDRLDDPTRGRSCQGTPVDPHSPDSVYRASQTCEGPYGGDPGIMRLGAGS